MDYNLGLLSDPEELRRLLAAAQVQPEDRSGANMQALLAFGAALMGAKKGQEFDALSRGALGGLVARNNALETAREGRSRTLVNAGIGQEILARGRKMKQEDEDRAAAMADQQEFNRLFAGNAPDVAPMANGKGPTVENAAAHAPVPNEVRQYRAMAQYYAMRRNGDMAKKMNDIADSLEEKYSQTPQAVRLPDGRIAYAQFGNKGGRKVAEGVSPAEKLHFANTGDKAAVGFDPYSGTQVSGGAAVNMSAAEKDRSAREWAGHKLSKERFEFDKQGVPGKPQWDSVSGQFVFAPTPEAPAGRAVKPEGYTPKPPEHTRRELDTIDSQLGIVRGARAAAKESPSAFSFSRGAATLSGSVPESLAGRFDSEKERTTRSYVYNVVSSAINERAGAAQSAQELQRLRSFLPAETDNAKQVEDKLTAFEHYLLDKRKAYGGQKSSGTIDFSELPQ